jgi:hypothetical protein
MNREQLPNELPEPVRRYFVEVARMEPPNDLMDTTLAQLESEPRENQFSLLPAFAAVAGAAAVVAAIVIGANLFGNGGVGHTPASSTTTPSASSASAPTSEQPWNLLESPATGDLPAGAYYLDIAAFPARIDFDVPKGWWYFWAGVTPDASDTHAILVNSLDTGAANGSAWGIAFAVVHEVSVDPCDAAAGEMDPSVTVSAAALADAFSSWTAFPATDVKDVTLSGFSGKRVVITQDTNAQCAVPVLFKTPSGYPFGPHFATSEPMVNQFILLDVEGSVLAIWTTDYPGTSQFEENGGASPDPNAHVEDQVQLHSILDSIVLTPR